MLFRSEIDREVSRAAELLRLGPYMDRKPLEFTAGRRAQPLSSRPTPTRAKVALIGRSFAIGKTTVPPGSGAVKSGGLGQMGGVGWADLARTYWPCFALSLRSTLARTSFHSLRLLAHLASPRSLRAFWIATSASW